MKTTLLKSLRLSFPVWLALWLVVPSARADDAHFFRMAGPAPAVITAFTPDGYITWLTLQPGTNYTVQTARDLAGSSNWVNYVQVPTTNWFTTSRLYDPNPPSGMVLIPGGSFTMGNCMGPGEGGITELPLHEVNVSAFYMDTNLVSYTLWTNVYQWATNHGYSFEYGAYGAQGKATNHPAQNMTWYDAVKWCNARSEKDGRVPCYYTNASQSSATIYRSGRFDLATNWVNWEVSGYRLPTEAEWEKAARGGASGHRFPWSDSNTIDWSRANYCVRRIAAANYYAYDVNGTSDYNPAWTNEGTPYTTVVGTFAPNGYGLYDMAGNVWQWCWDWYGPYSSGSQTDPPGPTGGSIRVGRGGGWDGYAVYCRAAGRSGYFPGIGYYYLGFRSVLPPGQ